MRESQVYNVFLEKYLNEVYYNIIINNYDEEYLNNIDEKNFLLVYMIFDKYKFYFTDDIILNYLEIFEMNPDDVINGIEKLKQKLGDNFVYIIGNDMRYLNELLEEN